MAYVRAQSFKTKRYIDETFDDDFDNLVPHWLDSADRRSIWQNLSNHQESLKSLQNLIGVGLGSLARTDPESYKPTLRYYILFNDLPTLLQAPHAIPPCYKRTSTTIKKIIQELCANHEDIWFFNESSCRFVSSLAYKNAWSFIGRDSFLVLPPDFPLGHAPLGLLLNEKGWGAIHGVDRPDLTPPKKARPEGIYGKEPFRGVLCKESELLLSSQDQSWQKFEREMPRAIICANISAYTDESGSPVLERYQAIKLTAQEEWVTGLYLYIRR